MKKGDNEVIRGGVAISAEAGEGSKVGRSRGCIRDAKCTFAGWKVGRAPRDESAEELK
jgi:hypothetical protein